MPEEERHLVHDELPDEFVLRGGEARPLYPGVQDLVFKRDRSLRGAIYRANIRDWFPNGTLTAMRTAFANSKKSPSGE
jgi:hypothetical protein